MKSETLKVVRIGNSRGVRLPAPMLSKYRIKHTIIAEQRADGILLRPERDDRLSWDDTFKAIGAKAREQAEEFSDMDSAISDGIDSLDR